MVTPSSSFLQRLPAVLLILLFVVVYAWGIGYFSPSSIFQHDEYMVLISPIQMYPRGDWIPRQTSSPPPAGHHDHYQTMLGPPHAFHYVFIAVVHTTYRIGKLFGIYSTPFDLTVNWELLKLIGRTLVILCSAGALLMTYRIGRLVFRSERVGLMAVVFMGLSQYYFYNSKIAKVDVPMIFWVTVSMYFLLRASEEGTTRQYAWSGFFCGLAAGTKLPGTFMVFPIILTYVVNAIRGRESYIPVKLAAAGLAALVGVFGTNPNLIVYFNDMLWAIKEFEVDLNHQGGIIHPWYHYYTTLDSPKFLLNTTFPGMFAGPIPTYLALGGFVIVLYRRRLQECVLVSFPLFYLALKLPTLVSAIYREYHTCVFVMALMAAYALHVLYQYTVERFVRQRLFGAACLILILFLILRTPIAYANWVNYYATQKGNNQIAVDWVDRHLPAGARFVVSGMVPVNRPSIVFENLAQNPVWRNTIKHEYEYAMLIPYKSAQLDDYSRHNGKLIKRFPALSTGYADIFLYDLHPTEKVNQEGSTVGESRRVSVRLTGRPGFLRVVVRHPCLKHPAHTLLVSSGDTVFPVALPTYADAVYVRIPDRINISGTICRVAVLPVELPPRHQVAGIDHLVASEKRIVEEYLCTDGSRQTVLMVDPEDLLGPLRGVTPERIPVLNPPKHLEGLIRDGDADPADVRIEFVEEEPGAVKEIQVERVKSLQDLQLTLADDPRGMTRIRVLPGNDPGVTAVVPDFVKVDILREDATRSTLLFQNYPVQSDTLLLPSAQLRSGDTVHLKFLNGRSGS